MTTTKALQHIYKVLAQEGGFDRVLEKVKIISSGGGHCVAEMKVCKEHVNRGDTLHGGMTATLVDMVSTAGLMTAESQLPGVSVGINVSYLKAAKLGDVIVIESKPSRIGSRLAFLSVTLTSKNTGALLATGSHTKFLGS